MPNPGQNKLIARLEGTQGALANRVTMLLELVGDAEDKVSNLQAELAEAVEENDEIANVIADLKQKPTPQEPPA